MKARIVRDAMSGSVDILFYEERDGKKYVCKPVQLVAEEHKDGAIIEPTIRINDSVFTEDVLRDLRKGVDELIGSEQVGELRATKYHLEDLRKLLKLKDKE